MLRKLPTEEGGGGGKQLKYDQWVPLFYFYGNDYDMCTQRVPSKPICITTTRVIVRKDNVRSYLNEWIIDLTNYDSNGYTTCIKCEKKMIEKELCVILTHSARVCYNCYKRDRYRFIIYYFFLMRAIRMENEPCDATYIIAGYIFQEFIVNEMLDIDSIDGGNDYEVAIRTHYPLPFFIPNFPLPCFISQNMIGLRFTWLINGSIGELELLLINNDLMPSKGRVRFLLKGKQVSEFTCFLDALNHLKRYYYT